MILIEQLIILFVFQMILNEHGTILFVFQMILIDQLVDFVCGANDID
jgi:hypothetical protein